MICNSGNTSPPGSAGADCRYDLPAAQPQLVYLLRLTGLDQQLPVFATTGDALARLVPAHSGCP